MPVKTNMASGFFAMGWRQQGHAEGKSPLVASQKPRFCGPVQLPGSPMYAWKRAVKTLMMMMMMS